MAFPGTLKKANNHSLPIKLPSAVPGGGGVLPYSLDGSHAAGFVKILPFTALNFANLVTLYKTKNAQCERSR